MYETTVRCLTRNCLLKAGTPTWRMYSDSVMSESQHETCSQRKPPLHIAFSAALSADRHNSCMDVQVEKDMFAVVMGGRLRTLRKARGMTQRELAIASGWTEDSIDTGYSTSTVAMWEQGRRRIRHEEAEWLGRFFKVPTAYMLGVIDKQEAAVLFALRNETTEK